MAHAKHEDVRRRFMHCCGYCGVSEIDIGGELTVDHFQPIVTDGNDDDENLIYACFRCNLFKGEFYPTPEDISHGRRILHPLRDDYSIHIRENEQTGFLEFLTDTGKFHISILRLNRVQLVENRLQRKLTKLLREARNILQAENNALHNRIAMMERYLQLLKSRDE